MDDSQFAHGAKAKVHELGEGLGLHHPKGQLAYIGRCIRQLRLEQGYSQEGFALRVGLARSYYGALERGERNFSVEHLLRIARGLGVEAGVLLPLLSSLHSADYDTEQQKGRQIKEQVVDIESKQVVQEPETVKRASYVSAGVAAQILGVNRRTIARWVADGTIEAMFVEDSNGKLIAVFHRDAVKKIPETPSSA
jgi:transcriptional regulator with XRE-family HTH domain